MVSAVRAISMEKITGDRLMREELLKIVYWNPETAPQGVPKPPARDRVEAAKSVVMLDLAVLNADQTAENCFRDFVDETASNPPHNRLYRPTEKYILGRAAESGQISTARSRIYTAISIA
jgi:hypothetical protein